MSDRHLTKKVTIDFISPIHGADRIELAHVGGWQIVVKKGDFQAKDTAIFFELGAALPTQDNRFDFLSNCRHVWNSLGNEVDSCYQLRTQKFRGELSQGLLMPIALFPELKDDGSDWDSILGVRNYDDLKNEWDAKLNGGEHCESKGSFPSFIPKTDLDRIQNHPEFFEQYKHEIFEVTDKADGQSITVYAHPDRPDCPIGVCSHNLELKQCADSPKWTTTKKVQDALMEMARQGKHWAVQGELVGPCIQQDRDHYSEPHFLVFRIFDIDTQKPVNTQTRVEWCAKNGIEHVYSHGEIRVFLECPTMDAMLAYADGKTIHGNPREGIVCKSFDGMIQFKVVSNKYLLKNNE